MKILILSFCVLTLSSCDTFLSTVTEDMASDALNGTTYNQVKAQQKAKAQQVIQNY